MLARIRKAAGAALKRAVEAVLGVFDAKSRLIFLDTSLPDVKQRFLKLHETGHGSLAWQRDLFAAIEDCAKTLSPETSELFDREANVFASEVLFQLDSFDTEAKDLNFGIKSPLSLGKRYGASAYAALRRYVARNARACAVLVLDPPAKGFTPGFVATRRRVEMSEEFKRRFSQIQWPTSLTAADDLGRLIPIARRMSRPQSFALSDSNGTTHECVGEGFSTPRHIFILIYPRQALTARRVIVPSGFVASR